MKRGKLILASVVLIAISLVGVSVYALEGGFDTSVIQTFEINSPITHTPTFLGNYPFILGGKNVMQNGTAYSYVWINASAIRNGDSFTAFPALNVGLEGGGINESNFTVKITFLGSGYGSSRYWLNFSIFIPILRVSVNSSQIGISSTNSRSSTSLLGSNSVEFFTQISNVVNSNNEFEYFFYIGNATTPAPSLAHGPVD